MHNHGYQEGRWVKKEHGRWGVQTGVYTGVYTGGVHAYARIAHV